MYTQEGLKQVLVQAKRVASEAPLDELPHGMYCAYCKTTAIPKNWAKLTLQDADKHMPGCPWAELKKALAVLDHDDKENEDGCED